MLKLLGQGKWKSTKSRGGIQWVRTFLSSGVKGGTFCGAPEEPPPRGGKKGVEGRLIGGSYANVYGES